MSLSALSFVRRMWIVKHLSRGFLLCGFLSSIYWAIRLAYADYLFHAGFPDRAAIIIPFSETYQAAIGNWKRAVEINPFFSKGWIQLGLAAEASGDMALAEKYLLQAAEVDKLFDPRWTLANFYLRRNRESDFWKWARLAADRSYGDRSGFFQLCMRMSDSPKVVLDRALPRDSVILADYTSFLLKKGIIEPALPVGLALADLANPQARGALFDLSDKLIETGQGPSAVVLWDRMADRKLAPSRAHGLANFDLKNEPTSRGFDWKLHWREGISVIYSNAAVRISLSGKQEESTELVSQRLWMERAGNYRLSYRYRTSGLVKDSGVQWTIGDTHSPCLSSEDWSSVTAAFRLKPGLHRLVLTYKRASGTSRQEGTVILSGPIRLEPADSQIE